MEGVIQNQLNEDIIHDHMTIREFGDPSMSGKEQSTRMYQALKTRLRVASLVDVARICKTTG